MKTYPVKNTADHCLKLQGKHPFSSKLFCIGGLTLLALACVTGSSKASDSPDGALYDLAPEGSAFVRLINLRKNASEVVLAKKSLKSKDHCSASGYRYFSPGEYQVSSQGMQLAARLEPQQAYSIVINDSQLMLIKDAYVKDRKLSLVSAYNFSQTTSLALKTADGRHTVFAGLEPLKQQARTINPVKAHFSLFAEDVSVLNVKPVIFERGVASSLLICGDEKPRLSRWTRQ